MQDHAGNSHADSDTHRNTNSNHVADSNAFAFRSADYADSYANAYIHADSYADTHSNTVPYINSRAYPNSDHNSRANDYANSHTHAHDNSVSVDLRVHVADHRGLFGRHGDDKLDFHHRPRLRGDAFALWLDLLFTGATALYAYPSNSDRRSLLRDHGRLRHPGSWTAGLSCGASRSCLHRRFGLSKPQALVGGLARNRDVREFALRMRLYHHAR